MMRRCFSQRLGQITRLATPVSSLIVMNMTPLAEPGFCRTSTIPALSNHLLSFAVATSAQVTISRLRSSLRRKLSG